MSQSSFNALKFLIPRFGEHNFIPALKIFFSILLFDGDVDSKLDTKYYHHLLREVKLRKWKLEEQTNEQIIKKWLTQVYFCLIKTKGKLT